MTVFVSVVESANLQAEIQQAKDSGKRILALSPAKIVKGVVKEYTLVVQ